MRRQAQRDTATTTGAPDWWRELVALILRELAPLDPADTWRLRTRALFMVLYASGARISEALALDRDAFSENDAQVIHKGGRSHTVGALAASA